MPHTFVQCLREDPVRMPDGARAHPALAVWMTVAAFTALGQQCGVPLFNISGAEPLDQFGAMVHVPYRGGGPALTDLLAGQVQVFFPPMVVPVGQVRAGKLRALAVTTATRSEALPDIPTVGEFVPGYEASVWFGLGAPNGTPAEIIDTLNKEINAALADPKIKARMAESGGNALAGSPADFGKLIADETEKWGKVVRAANIKPE
jgi:tripartite-type tricarboxylate transporter receptor subunit TctC